MQEPGEMGPAPLPHHLPNLGLPAGTLAAPTLRAGVSPGSSPQRRTAPSHRAAEHPPVPTACPGTVRPHGAPAQTRCDGLSDGQRRHHAAPGQQTASRPRDSPLAAPRMSRSLIALASPAYLPHRRSPPPRGSHPPVRLRAALRRAPPHWGHRGAPRATPGRPSVRRGGGSAAPGGSARRCIPPPPPPLPRPCLHPSLPLHPSRSISPSLRQPSPSPGASASSNPTSCPQSTTQGPPGASLIPFPGTTPALSPLSQCPSPCGYPKLLSSIPHPRQPPCWCLHAEPTQDSSSGI